MTLETRIASLDVLRGVAVMGIFAMNIVNFAMPAEAYYNPAAYGLAGFADVAAWAAAFVLIDGKMRGLFSFLFGASMLLVILRAERGGNAFPVHYARMGWLLVLGLAHAVLVWDGDILVHYAIVGSVAYAFREASPRRLAAVAGGLLVVQTIAITGLSAGFTPSGAAPLAGEIALHRGTYAGLVASRWHGVAGNTVFALTMFGAETLAYMLGGMWALRTGFLTGAWPRGRYLAVAAICLGVAVPGYAGLAWWWWRSGFAPGASFAVTLGVPTLLRPVMVVGLAALIILASARGGALVERIAAAGRAAFSNYLGASLVATMVFYGYGLGLYGRVSRWEAYPLVAAVACGMLLWSKPWLDRYRYGPFEWVWRSLARGEVVGMRR